MYAHNFNTKFNHEVNLQHNSCKIDAFMLGLCGVKVSRNTPERRSGAWKFKPGAFPLQNYWILQPEPTFLGPAS